MVQHDPLGLGLYGNDNGEEDLSSDLSDSDASEDSLDSAEVRAAEAAQKVKDYEASNKPKSLLPSALDAFEEVDDEPEFLNPEATRPIPTSATHGLVAAGGAGAAAGGGKPGSKRHGPKGRVPDGQAFDIAKLAPPVKGQQGGEKRPGAVIEAKAKKYKGDEGMEAGPQYTAAQIAMMGGNVAVSEAQEEEAAGAQGAAGDMKGPKPPSASKAMGVDEFLEKGVGGALLPRKQQDRKDKEKKKRALGQSSIGSWKTEAEMALRQQFDS